MTETEIGPRKWTSQYKNRAIEIGRDLTKQGLCKSEIFSHQDFVSFCELMRTTGGTVYQQMGKLGVVMPGEASRPENQSYKVITGPGPRSFGDLVGMTADEAERLVVSLKANGFDEAFHLADGDNLIGEDSDMTASVKEAFMFKDEAGSDDFDWGALIDDPAPTEANGKPALPNQTKTPTATPTADTADLYALQSGFGPSWLTSEYILTRLMANEAEATALAFKRRGFPNVIVSGPFTADEVNASKVQANSSPASILTWLDDDSFWGPKTPDTNGGNAPEPATSTDRNQDDIDWISFVEAMGDEAPAERFAITDLDRLGWYGRKLSAYDAEADALKAAFDKALAGIKRRRSAFEQYFGPQAEQVAREAIAGGKTKYVDTLGGRFSFRTVAARLEAVNAETATSWIKVNLADAITVKTVESIDKKLVTDYWKQTGTVPPGYEVEPERESFSHKEAKAND